MGRASDAAAAAGSVGHGGEEIAGNDGSNALRHPAAGDRPAAGPGPGINSSPSLPFFAQFRGAPNGNGHSGHAAMTSGISAAPGAGRLPRGVVPEGGLAPGAQGSAGGGDGGGSVGGATALEGILGGGMGSLGGDGKSDPGSDGRR